MSSPSLTVQLGSLRLASPIMPASGCFGPELGALIDFGRLGALVTKTIFANGRSGNPAPRITESDGVVLNSVGIPSPGIDRFLADVLPRYLVWGVPTIVSIGGLTVQEYFDVAERLRDVPGIAALEVNVSCPNLEAGGLEIGSDPRSVDMVIEGVVRRTTLPVIAKLTPNVTSIVEIGKAAESAGAAAVAAINTVVGLGVDLRTGDWSLGSGSGGMSGPAIKPIAMNAVRRLARDLRIPVIGVGGITNADDVLEFFLAGATAVQLGTITFARPDAMIKTTEMLEERMRSDHAGDLREWVAAKAGTRDLAGSRVPEPRTLLDHHR